MPIYWPTPTVIVDEAARLRWPVPEVCKEAFFRGSQMQEEVNEAAAVVCETGEAYWLVMGTDHLFRIHEFRTHNVVRFDTLSEHVRGAIRKYWTEWDYADLSGKGPVEATDGQVA